MIYQRNKKKKGRGGGGPPPRNKGMKKLCNYNVVGVNVTVNFLPFAGTIV